MIMDYIIVEMEFKYYNFLIHGFLKFFFKQIGKIKVFFMAKARIEKNMRLISY